MCPESFQILPFSLWIFIFGFILCNHYSCSCNNILKDSIITCVHIPLFNLIFTNILTSSIPFLSLPVFSLPSKHISSHNSLTFSLGTIFDSHQRYESYYLFKTYFNIQFLQLNSVFNNLQIQKGFKYFTICGVETG
jgi:hypothetical protein